MNNHGAPRTQIWSHFIGYPSVCLYGYESDHSHSYLAHYHDHLTAKWINVTDQSPPTDWTLAVGDLIERTCDSCAASHQKIVYKRLTNPGKIDFKTLFLDQVIRYLESIKFVYINY